MANVPMVNGISYAFAQITPIILGIVPPSVTEITYTRLQKTESQYGLGVQPVSVGYGHYEYKGSIKMLLDDWVSFIDAAPNNDPMSIPPFNIQVVYSATTRNVARTDVLQFCIFQEDPLKSATGDMKIEVEIPLLVGGIVKNVNN